VDYGTAVANTTYGVIGVKVWIYKGDLAPGEMVDYRQQPAGGAGPARGRRRPRSTPTGA
jgi:small subunit ribosomal protein S3